MQIPRHCYRDGSAQRTPGRFKSTRLRLAATRSIDGGLQEGRGRYNSRMPAFGECAGRRGLRLPRAIMSNAFKKPVKSSTDRLTQPSAAAAHPQLKPMRRCYNVSEEAPTVPSQTRSQAANSSQWTEANLFQNCLSSTYPNAFANLDADVSKTLERSLPVLCNDVRHSDCRMTPDFSSKYKDKIYCFCYKILKRL